MLIEEFDIKKLLEIQDSYRDIFYRVFVISVAFVLYMALDYPRRIIYKTVEKYIEILEALKLRFRFTQHNDYFLIKRVLYEQKTRHRQNIIAATLKINLENSYKNEVRKEDEESIKHEITMENEMTVSEENITFIEPKTYPRVKKRSLFRSTFTTKSRSSSVSTSDSSSTTHKTHGYKQQKQNLPDINKNKTEIKAASTKDLSQKSKHTPCPQQSAVHNIPVVIPATIVANCKVENVLQDAIQNFNSESFPFFDQNLFPVYTNSNKKISVTKSLLSEIPDTSSNYSLGKEEETTAVNVFPQINSKEKIIKKTKIFEPFIDVEIDDDDCLLKCHSKEKIDEGVKKAVQVYEIAPFLQPKFWFKRKEIWNQRCKYIVKSVVPNEKQTEHLCNLFSKNLDDSLQKPSRPRNEMNAKNKKKYTRSNIVQKFKTNYTIFCNDKNSMNVSKTLQRNNRKKVYNIKQNTHETKLQSEKGTWYLPLEKSCNSYLQNGVKLKQGNDENTSDFDAIEMNRTTSTNNCLDSYNVSTTNSSCLSVDGYFHTDNISSSLSDVSNIITIKNNNRRKKLVKSTFENNNKLKYPKHQRIEVKENYMLGNSCEKLQKLSNGNILDSRSTISVNTCEENYGFEEFNTDCESKATVIISKTYDSFVESDETKSSKDVENVSKVNVNASCLENSSCRENNQQESYVSCTENDKQKLFKVTDESSSINSKITLNNFEECKNKNLKEIEKESALEINLPISHFYKKYEKNSGMTHLGENPDKCKPVLVDYKYSVENYDFSDTFSEKSVLADSKHMLGEHEKPEEIGDLELLEETPNDSVLALPASGDFMRCEENNVLETIKEMDKVRDFIINNPTLEDCKNYLESDRQMFLGGIDEDSALISDLGHKRCKENNKMKTIQEIDEENISCTNSIMTLNSHRTWSADSIDKYSQIEVKEKENIIRKSCCFKPSISTIEEVTEDSMYSTSSNESRLTNKVFAQSRDGLSGLLTTRNKMG